MLIGYIWQGISKMQLLDLKAVATVVSLSVFTLRKFAQKGGMPHYRVGKKILVDMDEFKPWFAARYRPDNDSNNDKLQDIINSVIREIN
jgi:excisionase family DNA binding protein